VILRLVGVLSHINYWNNKLIYVAHIVGYFHR
jgi:hypothetical protein